MSRALTVTLTHLRSALVGTRIPPYRPISVAQTPIRHLDHLQKDFENFGTLFRQGPTRRCHELFYGGDATHYNV